MKFIAVSFLLLGLMSACKKDIPPAVTPTVVPPVVKPPVDTPVVPAVVPPTNPGLFPKDLLPWMGPNLVIGGKFVDSIGRSYQVWRNGIYSQTPDSVDVIAVSFNGNDLYTMGMYGVYFKNNVLPAVQNSSGGNKILAYGNDVYITLNYFIQTPQVGIPILNDAVYWKNGQVVNLSHTNGTSLTYSFTRDITHSGSDIYICGAAQSDTDNVLKAAYWKNDSIHYLQNGPNADNLGNSEADYITVIGDDVYIAGIAHPRTAYWMNGQVFYLGYIDLEYVAGIGVSGSTVDVPTYPVRPITQYYTVPTGIAVYGTDVYVVGWDSSGHAILWINGTMHILGGGRANCITIGQ